MNVLSKIYLVLSLCSISFLAVAKEANKNATQTIRLVQYRPIPTISNLKDGIYVATLVIDGVNTDAKRVIVSK